MAFWGFLLKGLENIKIFKIEKEIFLKTFVNNKNLNFLTKDV